MKNFKSILSIAAAAFLLISFNQNAVGQIATQSDTLITHSSESRGDEIAKEIKQTAPQNDPNADHTHPFLTFDELKSTSVMLRGESHGDEILVEGIENDLLDGNKAFEKIDTVISYSTSLRGESHGDEIKINEKVNTKNSGKEYFVPASKRHVIE